MHWYNEQTVATLKNMIAQLFRLMHSDLHHSILMHMDDFHIFINRASKNTTTVCVKHNCAAVHYTLTCMPSYARFHISSLPKPCKRIETSAGAVVLMVVCSIITGTCLYSLALHHRSQHTLKTAILITSASINNAGSDSQRNLITAWPTSMQIHVCACM